MATHPGFTGTSLRLETVARAIPRSAAGSAIRKPPTTLTSTSWPDNRTPRCLVSTAVIISRRFMSTPLATRRGAACAVGVTSAWTSTSNGRVPSNVGTIADP